MPRKTRHSEEIEVSFDTLRCARRRTRSRWQATITTTANGPPFLKGAFEIRDSRVETTSSESRATLCRCGHSGGKPFCDGSHGSIGWWDDQTMVL